MNRTPVSVRLVKYRHAISPGIPIRAHYTCIEGVIVPIAQALKALEAVRVAGVHAIVRYSDHVRARQPPGLYLTGHHQSEEEGSQGAGEIVNFSKIFYVVADRHTLDVIFVLPWDRGGEVAEGVFVPV